MKYGEAFARLGYELARPRLDWTAASDLGVCISIWREEIVWTPTPVMDSRVTGGPLERWRHKPGNRLRREHASQAVTRFDGWIDAVIVDGVPGQGVRSASPWNVEQRLKVRWRITDFDQETGHIRLEALPSPP